MGSHYWIRAYYTALISDESVSDLLAFCKRSNAYGILLFTQSFETEPGLLSADQIQKRASRLKTLVPVFRETGLDVHINVMSTLGHGLPVSNTCESLGFQPMIDHLGNESPSTPCPLDPAFIAHTKSLYAHMAGTGASAIWVDDDVRYSGHETPGTGCFCPLHLERVSERLGVPIRREDLVPQLSSDDPVPTPERAVWHQANSDAMVELAAHIREAVNGVNPKVELGLMTVGYPGHAVEGRNTPALFEALDPKATRWYRPGSGFWTDEHPTAVVDKTENSFRQVQLAGDRVRPVSEVENYPYARDLKSHAILRLELILNALAGFADQSLNLFNALHGVEEETQSLAELLADEKPSLDAIAEEVDGKRRVGLGLAASEEIGAFLELAGTKWYGEHSWSTVLARLGFPLGEPGAAPHFIQDHMAAVVPPEDIQEMALEGLVVDGPAAKILVERDLGPFIGVKTTRELDVCGFERFTDDPINGSTAGRLVSWRRGVGRTGTYSADPLTPATRIVSRMLNLNGSDLGPGILATPMSNGARVAVLPWERASAITMVNQVRRIQMQGIMRWASGDTLPAVAIDAPNVYPIVWSSADGMSRLMAVANLTWDAASKTTLLMDSGKWDIEELGTDGAWKAAKPLTADRRLLVNIAPWDVTIRRMKRSK